MSSHPRHPLLLFYRRSGNITGRQLAMPFANILRVLLITTRSLSPAYIRNTYHYPPRMIMAGNLPKFPVRSDGSLEEKQKRGGEYSRFYIFLFVCSAPSYYFPLSWRSACNASIYGNVPVMLISNYQGSKRAVFPFHYLADGNAPFYSALENFFNFFP